MIEPMEKDFLRAEEIIRECTRKNDLFEPFGESKIPLGGKRVRARIMLLTSRMLGIEGEPCSTLAAALELVHTASLLHDDVLDEALQRRGVPCFHRTNGNRAAVSVGDYIFTEAIRLVASVERIPIIRLYSRGINLMAAGELRELGLRGRIDVSREDYLRVVDDKTGSLFEIGFRTPGALLNLEDDLQKRLGRAGIAAGRLFQMADDLIDYCSHTSETGKDRFRDIQEGYCTLPLIMILESCSQEERDRIERTFEKCDLDEGEREFLADLVEKTEVRSRLEEEMAQQADKVIESLTAFPSGPYHSALIRLVRELQQRTS